jgi:hypothetical protein
MAAATAPLNHVSVVIVVLRCALELQHPEYPTVSPRCGLRRCMPLGKSLQPPSAVTSHSLHCSYGC